MANFKNILFGVLSKTYNNLSGIMRITIRAGNYRIHCLQSMEVKIKFLIFAFCVVFAFGDLRAQKNVWQPSPGHTQIPIWPGAVPDAGRCPVLFRLNIVHPTFRMTPMSRSKRIALGIR